MARFFGALLAIAALTVSLILGFVFFLVVLGVGLVVGVIVWLKIRRLQRDLAADVVQRSDTTATVLEGDYEVVRQKEPRDR